MIYETVMTLISAGSGITGAVLGAAVSGKLSRRNEADRERKQRLREQLDMFYGPLLSIRYQIKAIKEFQLELSTITGEELPKIFVAGDGDRVNNPDTLRQISEDRSPSFQAVIEYSNRQYLGDVLPAYRKMITVFQEKLHLAEPSTQKHLPELIRFVEIDERWVAKSLPREVVPRLNQSEERLKPFYEDLEANFAKLQKSLAQ